MARVRSPTSRAISNLPLQRHLSVLTKSTHVESRFCGRSRQVKAAFCTPVNPCVRSVCSRSVVVGINRRRHRSFQRIMTGFDEYGCGDRIDEHLRRNLIGNLVQNGQESVVSNDHIFSPSTRCWKERNTLAFAKPLRRLCVCSEPNDRPDALKPRYPYSSFRNGLDRSSLRKSGKNLDIT